MMPSSRQHHHENTSNTANNSSNNSESGSSHSHHTGGISNGMNVNLNGNVNYSASRGSGTSNSAAGGSSNRAGVGDQIRQRYGHHGPGGADSGSSVGMPTAFGGAMGGGQMSMAAMGDYSGLTNPYGRAAGLGPSGLGPFNPAASAGSGGMNAAAMNSSALYPHIGAAAAGMTHHQSPQQQAAAVAALGDQLDFRQGGPNTGGGVAGNSQAEQEEELLLNILIARRQRQQLGPAGAGGGPAHATSWADDFMRLREKTMNQQPENMGGAPAAASASVGDRMPYDGMTNALQQGDSSHRSHSAGRMSIGSAAGAMAHMQNANMNMNNMGMNMQPQNRQFLSDPSGRLRHRGSGMGFPMGSPQGAWMGATNAAAAMHTHPNNPANNTIFAHGGQRQDINMNMKSNTQLGIDVLERVDRMMPVNMMHDARMAEQGNVAGQNAYQNQFAVGQHHGMSMQDPPVGLGKRSLEGAQGMDKAGKMMQHPSMHMFQSPQQQNPHAPTEEAQPAAKKKRLHKRKPADMPRRPLSAYNLFFSEERERILREIEGKTDEDTGDDSKGKDEAKPKALLRPLLPSEKKRRPHRKTHGKISFQLLAQKVGQRWKELPDHERQRYKDMAQEDMKRQKKAMEEYYQKRSVLASNDPPTTKDSNSV